MIMKSGITNDVWFYFLRTLPNFTDILTTNFSINSVSLNTNTNILSITTDAPHNLEENEYVFLQNILYGYEINYIKEVEKEINFLDDKFVEFEISYDIQLPNNYVIPLKNFTNPILNSNFVVYETDIIEGKTIISGKFKDRNIDTAGLDLINEGSVFLNIQDDMFGSGAMEKTGFSTTRVGGTYNGLKIVDSIVDEYTFTVDLTVNTKAIIPPAYSNLIDFETGVVKTNIQIYTTNEINDNLTNDSVADLLDNKGVLYFVKQNNLATLNGFDTRNTQIDPRTGFDLMDEQISFIATLVFRVERESETHYVLGKMSNQISDHLTTIMRSITARYFFEEDTILKNTAITTTLYKSYWNGSTQVRNLNSVNNSVFKSVDFEFKITRQDLVLASYNNFQINEVGFPIRKVINQLDFVQSDEINTVYE